MVGPVCAQMIARIFDRDNGLCRYCGDWAGEVDHVIPCFAGGKNTDTNLVSTCAKCNAAARAWMFPNWEAKKRYVLLRRFGKRRDWEAFREQAGGTWGKTPILPS